MKMCVSKHRRFIKYDPFLASVSFWEKGREHGLNSKC